MPSSSRSPIAAAAHPKGFDAAATVVDAAAAEPQKAAQRAPFTDAAAAAAAEAAAATAAAATAAAATAAAANDYVALLEKKLQLCSAGDICLIKGTASALVSVSLEPQVVQQLCRSLPHDLLKDFPPSLLLLLHEQQQQQQKDEVEPTSLLLGLAVALEKRCSGWKRLPSSGQHAAAATEIAAATAAAATTEAAAAAPEFAVAILEAQTKILHKLREGLLEPLTDSLNVADFTYAATGQLGRHAVELLRHGSSSNNNCSSQQQQQLQLLQQQLGSAYRSCRCLIPASSPRTFLSPILAAALEQHVLLLHPQVMPLLGGLIAAAADVAALLHCSSSSETSSSSSSSSSRPASWCPLSDEQLLHAGHELLAAATHLFPSEYFQQQQQQQQQQQLLLQQDTLRALLLEAPKDSAYPPINAIHPQLISRPLTDRQDAWIDVLQQLLLLLPPGRPRLDWVVAAGLDVLLLQLLLRSSLPLVRPLLLPLLLDSCGVELQLEEQQQQQQNQQQAQQGQQLQQKLFVAAAAKALRDGLHKQGQQLQQKLFVAAAAKALRDGLHMAASITFVEGLAAAAAPASPRALAARLYARVQQQPTAPLLQISNNSGNKSSSNSSSNGMCVFKQVASAIGGRSRPSSSPGDVVADVLQLLLLERFQGDAAAPGSSSSSGSCRRQLCSALLYLIDRTTAEAAAAAATAAGAAGDMPPAGCNGCEVSAHLFGVLLLLSCPQQWVCDRLCFLACSSITSGPSLLLQPDCLLEAVSLIGDAPRRFVCSAATRLLLLLQQHQQHQEQQQQMLRACACLIDMYDPCLFEECSRTLQQGGRSSCLLQQQGRLYRLLLLQRLFSVSVQQRQSAAAALKGLLQLPDSLGTDPVGAALRLWSNKKQEQQQQQQQQQVCGKLLEEAEVQLLCSAAANRRLCAATRTESLNTLQVYVRSSPADARPFLRSLCCSLLGALPGHVRKGGTAAAAAAAVAAAASAAAPLAEVGATAYDGEEEPLLLSLLELLRLAVQQRQQQLQLQLQQPLLLQQQEQEQQALLTAAARVLSLPLLLLPPGDPLLHPVLEVYRHLLGDTLLLLCFSKQEALSLACLQLCAVLLFHPQRSLLLPHRLCQMSPQVEALLREHWPQQQLQQQQQQQQQQQPRLLLPAWLSLRVELPMETEAFSCCTAAQAAWANRSEDLAFFVASQIASDTPALQAAAAAVAATAAFAAAEGSAAPLLQHDGQRLEDSSTCSISSSRPSSATIAAAAATTAAASAAAKTPAAAAAECSVCLCRSQSLYLGSALSESSRESTNNKTEFSLARLSLSRQTAQQLLLPVHPKLKKLLGVLSHPPLLQGALPPLRLQQQQQQQQQLGDGYCTLPVAVAASSPPAASAAAAGSNPPSDVATYVEALQYCRRITAALQLPGDSAAAAFCCLHRRGLAAAAATARCCCCSLSVAPAKGLRAVAVAVKRYTYPYLQQLAQQVAETMLGLEEQTAAAAAPTAAGWEMVHQQPSASGGGAAACSSEVDLLLLGAQLLTELLPLAAVAAAPAGAACCCNSSNSNTSTICSECECCSRWMALPNLSQFCGSLLGVSAQLPLLRRAALQLAAVALPHSLPPRPCSISSRMCLTRAQTDDIWLLDSAVFAAGLSSSSSSSVLLQLQLQQLLQLHARLTAEDETSMQEQQPLADALEALRVCIAHNPFAVAAAAAAQAAAEWQELAATDTTGLTQDHYQQHQQQQQQQALLEIQVKLLFSFIGKAHPAIRVAAWRCLRGCLQVASGLLQQPQQQQQLQQQQQQQLQQQQQQDLLLRVYSWTCSEICQRLLGREGLLPGGLCCCCSSSCREVAEALQCLSTLRWSSRRSSNSSSSSLCVSGVSAAGIKGGCAGSAEASAAAALDEWIASESFVHRTFAGFLTLCNSNSNSSSSSSKFGAMPHKSALNGLTAALELLCCSAQAHSGPLLQLLQQPQHQQQQQGGQMPSSAAAYNRSSSSDYGSNSSILSSIVAAVCPRPHPLLVLPPVNRATGAPSFSAAAAAAVAAAGTQDAAAALAAAANAATAAGASVCLQELTKCCRALQLLLTLLDGTGLLGPCLGSSNCAAAAAAATTAEAAGADAGSFLLLQHVETLVQTTTMLLLRPFRSSNDSCSCCCGEELECWRSRPTVAAAAAASGRCSRAIADICHELLLLLLRLFVALHEQTALQVAKQLPGETSMLLPLLQQREELQRQQQQQQQLDDDLLQALQGTQQLGSAAAAAAAAAAAKKAAAEYLWASPSLWLFIVLCFQPSGAGVSSSFGVYREAAALATCLLRLSYDSSLTCFRPPKSQLEAEGPPEVLLPFSGAPSFLLPPLLPPLPHGHLQLYATKDTQKQQQQQQILLLPTDPRMAVGLFSAAADLLLQQLRCRSLAAACAVSMHQRTPPGLRRHSAAATAAAAAAAAASPTGSRGRGRSKVYGIFSPSPLPQQQQQQRRPSSSCCSSPLNASQLSVHSMSAGAAADTNHIWQQHQQQQPADFALGNDLLHQHHQQQQQQQLLLLQQNRQEYRNSCLLHALGELLLLLFAGHPTAATAAAWTRFISPTDVTSGSSSSNNSSSRKPQEPLLLPAHLVAALECLLHGAAAASLLNFAATLGAQRLQQKPPSFRQQQQQQQQQYHRDDGVGDLGSLLSANNCGRSCGNLLLHRVLLLLQLLSAACTCTPDGFAAAAAAAAPLPFGAVVAAVSALWRLCSLQQTLLSLLLQFLQRCISARQQISLLGAPSSRETPGGASGLQLLETGEALLRLRLQEAGVVAALVDSVCNSLNSSSSNSSSSSGGGRTRQQKLPPRLLCSVLLLLQHTVSPGVEGPPLAQLIGALADSLRPRLQQLLQRNNSSRTAAAAAASSTRMRWSLSPVDLLLLSAQLDCLGAAAAAAAAATADRRCLTPLFSSGAAASSKGRTLGGSDKESLEDFVTPLLLPELPLQLVAALLHFLVSLTAATGAAAAEAAADELLDMSLEEQQKGEEASSVCVSPRKSKAQLLPRAAARAVLLLQHSAAFHDALLFLFVVRLSPQTVFSQPLHNTGREGQQQQQQQQWGGALRDALLLLLHVFLSDLRPASKLKQHAGPLLAALQDWMGALQHELQVQQQLQQQLEQQGQQVLLSSVLHEIRHLLLSSIRALTALGAPGGP
ncbi:hypothetical protein, conserved [Eimeria praecox]|uniref:Uncharacterized protein n=1 Tax=Eimeria praecox TaxID=51316 RepID=U6G0L6_9EIME|nr:hypothetical protein, conserved [Eimeria praecox]